MAGNYWQDVDGNWANTANWSAGHIPQPGEDAYILAGSQAIATNIDQSALLTAAAPLNSLTIGMGFTGQLGDATHYAILAVKSIVAGAPQSASRTGSGSGRLKLSILAGMTAPCTALVLNTSQSTLDSTLESLRFLFGAPGGGGSNKLIVNSGLVGVGTTYPTETSTLNEVDVTGGQANLGYGVTWTTASVAGGGSKLRSLAAGGTSLNVGAGAQATIYGSAKVTNVTVGGTVYLNNRPAAGNIADVVNLLASGIIDFTGNSLTGVIGTLNHYKGGTVNDSPAMVSPNQITYTTWNRYGGVVKLS